MPVFVFVRLAAVIAVEAVIPTPPMSIAPELVRRDPIETVTPPPRLHPPTLSSQSVMFSTASSLTFTPAPASMISDWASPKPPPEIVAVPDWISAGVVGVGTPELQSLGFASQSPLPFHMSTVIDIPSTNSG